MHISDWSISKKMMLPDHCFGQREVIQLAADLTNADPVYVISPAGLPENTVIWELVMAARGTIGVTVHVGLALADQLPASQAAWDALELCFSNVITSDGVPGHFEVSANSGGAQRMVRKPFAVSGRRFACRFIRHIGIASEGIITITYSSMPYEVPTCLFSA